jgi:acetylornithine deacetylase
MINELKEKAVISRLGDGLPLNSRLYSEAVSLLQKLIKTPSFSGEESAAADIVQQYLLGYSIKVKRNGNNVWCHNKYFDPAKPTILLNSHLDTVKPNEGYTNDPFCPDIDNGKLFGLGSNDAGGCLVSLIATFLHFYSYQGLEFNLCLAATAEEENSGINGIKLALPFIGKLDAAIVGEPTLLQMAVAEKGNLIIDCVSIGRSGHAARDEGDNAIYKCMKEIEWFRNYRFIKSTKNLSPVKMTVTAIKAGLQHNIIPAQCTYTVDIRNDSTFTHEEILATIRRKITANITVRPNPTKASTIASNHPIVQTGIALGCKTYHSPTTSDRAWLTIPSVKIGPGDSARPHSPDEFIFLEEIKNGISFYIRLLETMPLVVINNPNKYQNKNEIEYINN